MVAKSKQKMQCCVTLQDWDKGRMEIFECGIRWAEAKRKEKATEGKQAVEQEQGKTVRLSEQEDQPEKMRAQNIDE